MTASTPHAEDHPVLRFWRLLDNLDDYPPQVVRLDARRRLADTAFFSASTGLWGTSPANPLPPFPYGGVMFVGNNLDSEERYAERLAAGASYGSETGTPTWRQLLALLSGAGIEPNECFFTNAWVGLKAGGGSNTGELKIPYDSDFARWSRDFLAEQVRVMKPRVIAALGQWVPPFLARMTPDLAAWSRAQKFSALDEGDGALRYPVELAGHRSAVVALVHPSYRPRHVGSRRFRTHTGHLAEVEMMREAARLSRRTTEAP